MAEHRRNKYPIVVLGFSELYFNVDSNFLIRSQWHSVYKVIVNIK